MVQSEKKQKKNKKNIHEQFWGVANFRGNTLDLPCTQDSSHHQNEINLILWLLLGGG